MTRAPRLKGKEIVRALERAGFQVDRIRGSHIFVKHSDGRATTIPNSFGRNYWTGSISLHPSGCRNDA
ncbi:MAG TPA: type II toxin-antitoxin system HicA family toxin [Rugosimonospora sp.]|nr:type II toxin-antitoxin system HicA family toxin [Rugosimonospora sp.]